MFPTGLKNIISGETCDPRPLVGGAAIRLLSSTGNRQYVSFGNSSELINAQLNGVWTASIFCYFRKLDAFIFCDGDSSFNQKINIATSSGNWRFIYNGVQISANIPHNLNLNQWYHIAVAFNGGFNIWVDGLKVVNDEGNETVSVINSVNPIRVSNFASNNRPDLDFYGFSIHGGVLSDSEIKSLYNGTYDYSQNTYLLSKSDEMTGSTAFDSSGNEHNGTVVGGAIWVNTNEYSYRDNLGYNLNGSTYIPRDESNQDFDVLENELENKGKACNI